MIEIAFMYISGSVISYLKIITKMMTSIDKHSVAHNKFSSF